MAPEGNGSLATNRGVSSGKEGLSAGRDIHIQPRGVDWALIAIVAIVVVALVVVFVAAVIFWPKPEGLIPSPTPTDTPPPTAIYISTRAETPTTVERTSMHTCPYKVLVLIRPFEGSGDLSVERSILEAFERPIGRLVETGIGQIEVQIEDSDTLDVDYVFVVEGWYDSAAVHARIRQKKDNNQFLLLDCCPPGEANVVPPKVVIAVCSCVAKMWREEGCPEAAIELLLQIMEQSRLDPAWEKAFFEFARRG